MKALFLLNENSRSGTRMTLLLMLIATWFTACKIFRHKAVMINDSLRTEAVDTRIETQATGVHSSIGLTTEIRSGERRSLVEIQPEGTFTYSPESGFSGTAKLLRITGAESRQSLRRDSVQALDNNSTQQRVTATSRIKNNTVSRTKISSQEKRNSYKWVWLVAGLLILAGLTWRFRKSFSQICTG
ncbi:MAG: hypothetical protein K0S09_3181 [Sphingobacteriaceae bacterium]|jgi:hypothetical protein|nr:hypothetical protein [Sphingobacteriaceae bacterium]